MIIPYSCIELSIGDAALLRNENASSKFQQNTIPNRFTKKKHFKTYSYIQDIHTHSNTKQVLKCYRCGSTTNLANKCNKINEICHFSKIKGYLQEVCNKTRNNKVTTSVD